ncbi:SgcJ/EcaC family oxidoreductase [Ruegeria sp. 2205SS24-7]|uniref:YybH family protein n=1 Tax=Ruegeria discodermiae TaxID=3064389 RepID=UPI002742264E|nr:SgcJ/EcaC family oxidoreductase [Ruegeria sp. 2205SS24-7]MDP5220082.1 SgcJ/EcaC family oxidoreductase [Ruegeria sp. 2205SS24-7]
MRIKYLSSAFSLILLTSSAVFATEAEIEAARAQWMELFSAGDGAAVAEQSFTENAVLLPPDSAPVEGRDAIATFWQGAFDAGVTGLKLDTISIDVIGDTGIVTGYWTVTVPTEGGGTADISGKELLIYKKESDGVWRASHDIWNDGK